MGLVLFILWCRLLHGRNLRLLVVLHCIFFIRLAFIASTVRLFCLNPIITQNNFFKNPGRNRFSSGGWRTGGPAAPGWIYDPYFYILQAPEDYKNDLATSVPTLSPTTASLRQSKSQVPS
jgi:hypothetical protein